MPIKDWSNEIQVLFDKKKGRKEKTENVFAKFKIRIRFTLSICGNLVPLWHGIYVSLFSMFIIVGNWTTTL